MRIALISDIHGNLTSLEAVLADIRQQQVNQIICLGDVATLGPQPCEVMSRLQALDAAYDCTWIMGNHDAFLLDPELLQEYMDAEWFANIIEWCAQQLSTADLAFLRTFQPRHTMQLDNGTTLLCFHGSPRSNIDLIVATTPPSKLDKMLDGYKATVMAGGHSHVQMMRRYKGNMLVNVGSVGMPFRKMPFKKSPRILPWAEYAVLNWHNDILGVELRRVPIDMEKIRQAAASSDLPSPDEWMKNWVKKEELM